MMLDFENLERSKRPNNHLSAPDGLCQSSTPDAIAPIFEVPIDAVKTAFMTAVNQEPRTEVTDQTSEAVEFVQRTKVFRFPDLVSVRFIANSPTQTTLAIYSRAVYGYSDMGVNVKRVERLIDKTTKALSTE